MHQLIASPRKTRRPRSPRNEQCGDCGGSGANSSGKTCGTCNGLGEIHCRAGRQTSRVLSRSVIRKEGHRWPTL
ncbi:MULTISPECIES: hypothetical protein [Streptomyces]|uniref:Molecular chaperone DnaJ n=1 Tax=Streptomyces californicus TaxID=67351 RepID=A0ABX7J2M3_9ACTN|nr:MULTISPECIES: hypothetical protein [Streptomyces]QRV28938.1 hypothetical protein I6J39_17640 [Streptomyces californicus]QRV42352.1 hypothetical protein I6J41_17555 [Streptomyces californicus]QRV49032.1 hypothetical protein I6J43_17190 [Streptomyces californicus]